MIKHYLKVAFRNLLKYKTQSLISILGMAFGFACFALASLWIRHEMTYDTFHDGADRIYRIRKEEKGSANGLGSVTPYPLAAYLKETFPEVESACIFTKPAIAEGTIAASAPPVITASA